MQKQAFFILHTHGNKQHIFAGPTVDSELNSLNKRKEIEKAH
jgi:hypothetical protein